MNTPKVMKYEMHSADGTGSPDSNSPHHDVSANPNITANKRHVLFQSSQPTELLSAKDTLMNGRGQRPRYTDAQLSSPPLS